MGCFCCLLSCASLCLAVPCCVTVCDRSLPLEMVELEKHVSDLSVEQNPLPVLPDKWHVRFGPKEETRRPAGYTSGEVRCGRPLLWTTPFFHLPWKNRRSACCVGGGYVAIVCSATRASGSVPHAKNIGDWFCFVGAVNAQDKQSGGGRYTKQKKHERFKT